MHSIETMKKLEKQAAEERAQEQPANAETPAQEQKPVDQGHRA